MLARPCDKAPARQVVNFFEGLYITDPVAAISHFSKPLQVVVGERDDIVTPQPYYGETNMTCHDGYEELAVVDSDHVFDVFAGNGAPALDEAIAESVDWFSKTLRRYRWQYRNCLQHERGPPGPFHEWR